MPSELYNHLQGNLRTAQNVQQNQETNDVNFSELMQNFMEYRNNYKGDPKAEFMKLVQSGQIAPWYFHKLQEIGMMCTRFMPR